MKYLKKANELFIRFLLVIVYSIGIGLARVLFIITEKKEKNLKDSYWKKTDTQKDISNILSPY